MYTFLKYFLNDCNNLRSPSIDPQIKISKNPSWSDLKATNYSEKKCDKLQDEITGVIHRYLSKKKKKKKHYTNQQIETVLSVGGG